MSYQDTLRSQNEKVLKTFLEKPFWEHPEIETSMIDKDCVFDFPYAPPGMPKTFPRSKRPSLKDWYQRTTKNWSIEGIIVYPTTNTSRFWVESTTHADVNWGSAVVRPFNCYHMQLIVIENGKITLARTWSDPLAYYLAAGINLPVFNYTGEWPVPGPRPDVKPPTPVNEEEAKARRTELFNYFVNADISDGEHNTEKYDHWFTPDYQVNLPFMVTGMQRHFTHQFMDSSRDWLLKTQRAWTQNLDYERDEFLDPDVIIVENNGTFGMMQWDPNGNVSGYTNDYVLMVVVKDFRICEFREFLDPVRKLITMGALIPVFPWFY